MTKVMMTLLLALWGLAAQGQTNLSLNLNYCPPLSDGLADVAEAGLGATLQARYLVAKRVNLGLTVGYLYFDAKPHFSSTATGDDGMADAHTVIIPATAGVDFQLLTGKVRPWLGVDVGFYNYRYIETKEKRRGIEREATINETKPAIAPGAGLAVRLNDGADVALAARYNYIMTEHEATTFLTCSVGLVVWLGGRE